MRPPEAGFSIVSSISWPSDTLISGLVRENGKADRVADEAVERHVHGLRSRLDGHPRGEGRDSVFRLHLQLPAEAVVDLRARGVQQLPIERRQPRDQRVARM